MLLHLRQAEKRVGRKCKVSFDLAGPKLRTGSIEPGIGVVKWKPQRDPFGHVIAPAIVQLTDASIAPPPGQWSISGAGVLIASARAGDVVELVDARGKHRRLEIIEVSAGACLCHSDSTAYVTSGTDLRLRRGKRIIASMTVGDLPPRPQSLLLRVGDQLEVVGGEAPGRPARIGADGRLLESAVISCMPQEIFGRVRPGERIYFDDGRIGGVIRAVGHGRMRVEIVSTPGGAAKLASEKGINLPDTDLRLPALTAKDREDLEFVVRHADMVALSFVQRAEDVQDLISELAKHDAARIGIVLKIETRRGFDHLASLLLAAMRHPLVAVMVARGDLGVEVGFERLSEVQEEILWLCEAAHLPVIWATQVLELLAQKGMSSRAEVTDAAMSGRAECVMLNKGPFILEALSFLGDVLHRMQAHQTKKSSTLRRLHVSDLGR
jgi:pyruvate kinase